MQQSLAEAERRQAEGQVKLQEAERRGADGQVKLQEAERRLQAQAQELQQKLMDKVEVYIAPPLKKKGRGDKS